MRSADDLAVGWRRWRALRSLEGLSAGDAFGERFFVGDALAATRIAARELPPAPWAWTDDTAMAIPIVERLIRDGRIEPDDLARDFARRYAAEPMRGYGRGTHQVLASIGSGIHWSRASRVAFADGSRGNGSAMRSAPIGAYFADDLERVVDEARATSMPTHGHPDGVAGAIAIALGAALVAGLDERQPTPGWLLWRVMSSIPDSAVRRGLQRALEILEVSPQEAAATLGSGQRVLAEDTVPFALWCADRHPDSFEEAMWTTVAGLGDRDTTCAMVGGIVGAGPAVLPSEWISRREGLPAAKDLVAGRESVPSLSGVAPISIDPMTGVLSRNSIALMREGCGIAMVDIVEFRRVNDRYPHPFGDQVLNAVATRLRDDLAPLRVFRSGGDEFMVEINPAGDHASAERLALRILGIISTPIEGLEEPLEATVGITLRQIEGDVTPVRIRAEWSQWKARSDGKRYVIEGEDSEVWSG